MSAGDLLGRIVRSLNEAGIKHMVAGSFASTYHGEPRTTQDIDIVIDGSRAAIKAFVASLDAESYYCDLDVALDAHSRRGQFNLVDMQSGWKIDFMIRKDRPFSVLEFSRRIPVTLLGCELFVATAEDTIIAKLDWARESLSERQLRDV
ncbi:MAG: hypothetical protein JKY56_27475, partial [Kofleriaceae bacterium]|nr:hypothetical protein [Kofleriaceae bacterium]